jgi:acetolactate synthase-1/2/3 large subunit
MPRGEKLPRLPSRKISIDAPRAPDPQTVRAVASAIRANPGRVAMVVGGTAARADAFTIAGRIAIACDVRLFNEVLVAHTQRGLGRVAPVRIPYPIDLALEVLKDVDLLVLVGAPEPLAFFAYPGKPGRLVRDGCTVLTLAKHGEDLKGALEALHDELGVKRTQSLQLITPNGNEGYPVAQLTDDAVAVIVAHKIPENAVICEEAITSGRRFFALSAFAAPHDFISPTGGSIGDGIPLATGAAIGCPDRKVINLQADGSAMYTVQGFGPITWGSPPSGQMLNECSISMIPQSIGSPLRAVWESRQQLPPPARRSVRCLTRPCRAMGRF